MLSCSFWFWLQQTRMGIDSGSWGKFTNILFHLQHGLSVRNLS